jgi:hypothetical protein
MSRFTTLALFYFSVWAPAQVLTSQYDNARTGATLTEKVLTPANVNVGRFGKIFSLKVDGDVYAQPLFVPKLEIPGKGIHNVLFIATEHNSVYAFDADTSADPLWHVNFLNAAAGVTAVPSRDVRCPFITPEIGITPTPVIDAQSGTIYILARTKESGGLLHSDRYVQKLHALAIATGAEKFGGPVEIKASVKGRGAGASNGEVAFEGLRELPRAAMLLSGGQVYMTWGSSCDVGPYHGWVMSYDARTLAQTAVLNVSPDAEESGIWQSAVEREGDESRGRRSRVGRSGAAAASRRGARAGADRREGWHVVRAGSQQARQVSGGESAGGAGDTIPRRHLRGAHVLERSRVFSGEQ